MKLTARLTSAEIAHRAHHRLPSALIRWALTIGLSLGAFVGRTAPALADGYWTLTKSLPASLKPQTATPNQLGGSAEELSDGSVMHHVSVYSEPRVWQSRSMWSAPPAVLVPGQHVRFGAYQIVVRNDFGHNSLSVGTKLYYYYGIDKNPGGPSQIIDTGVWTSDAVQRPSFSGRADGVLTVPSQNSPGNFLWLSLSIDPPRYVKYYQYTWNPGPVPANVPKGDITLPVPQPSNVSQGQTPPDQGGPDHGGPGPSAACPDSNPSALELQICHIEVKAGQTIQVPIYLLKSSNLGNLNLEVRYNPAVAKTNGKAVRGPLLQNSRVIFDSNPNQPGLIRIGLASSAPITGSGVMVLIPFTIVGQPGSKTTLEIKDTAANTANNTRPSFVLRPGEIVVAGAPKPPTPTPPVPPSPPPSPPPPPPAPSFTALDALKALQMSVGLLQPDMRYDLDKNSQITSNDARLILLRVVGK